MSFGHVRILWKVCNLFFFAYLFIHSSKISANEFLFILYQGSEVGTTTRQAQMNTLTMKTSSGDLESMLYFYSF
jgi:hypothetical protein